MRISDWSSDVCSSDLDILPANVGLRAEAISNHAAVLHPRQDCLHFRMIEAEQSCAVKRDIANKFDKGVLHPVEAAIMVEMFGIDIGDDRYGAVQAQETAVAFIGFNNHPVARSEEHTSEL